MNRKLERSYVALFARALTGQTVWRWKEKNVSGAQKVCELEETAHRWVFLGNSGTGNSKEAISLPCICFLSCLPRRSKLLKLRRHVMKEKIIFAPNEFSTGRECSPLNLLGQFWNRKFESCLAVPGRSDPPVELFHCDMSSNLEMKEKHRFRA